MIPKYDKLHIHLEQGIRTLNLYIKPIWQGNKNDIGEYIRHAKQQSSMAE